MAAQEHGSATDCRVESRHAPARGRILFAGAGSDLPMPIYEYACAPCGKSFEELVIRKSDEAGVKCPACGSAEVARQMSRPAAARSGAGDGGSFSPAPSCGPVG